MFNLVTKQDLKEKQVKLKDNNKTTSPYTFAY